MPLEGFFGYMKDEITFMQFVTLEEVKLAVNECIVYNNYEWPQWYEKNDSGTIPKSSSNEYLIFI